MIQSFEKDSILEVQIDSVAFGGEGVAKADGFVIFVPDVISGERVRIRITDKKHSFAKAELLEILEASPDRISPLCPVYGLCGGCQYQHMTYEKSLALKKQQIQEVLERLGGIQTSEILKSVRPSPAAFGYRNTITIHFWWNDLKYRTGYFARDNRTFIEISDCPIASSKINEAIRDIDPILKRYPDPKYIKMLVIKEGDNGVFFYPHYRKSIRFRTADQILFRLGEFEFAYGLNSFFQVNSRMIPELVGLVSEGLGEPEEGEVLFDLYAGAGLFSIALSKKFKNIVGIELSREATQLFNENLKRNGISHITTVCGDVTNETEGVFANNRGRVNSIVIDPPREGMKPEVARFLAEKKFKTIVYVSCDPATLARDLKILRGTYEIVSITPLDMFPQTKHVETVTVLRRADKS